MEEKSTKEDLSLLKGFIPRKNYDLELEDVRRDVSNLRSVSKTTTSEVPITTLDSLSSPYLENPLVVASSIDDELDAELPQSLIGALNYLMRSIQEIRELI